MIVHKKMPKIAGLILAGGAGTRMGGQDKGLVLLNGQPLLSHVLQRLRPQVDWWAISANRHCARYAAWGLPVWPDAPLWQGMGPLAALATAAQHVPPACVWLQCAACDTPRLPLDLTQRLRAACPSVGHVAIPCTAHGCHFASALIPRDLLLRAAAFLARGERRLQDFLQQAPNVKVQFADDTDFININDAYTLAQWHR